MESCSCPLSHSHNFPRFPIYIPSHHDQEFMPDTPTKTSSSEVSIQNEDLAIGWKQVGKEIVSEEYYDRGGDAVAMNNDGTRVAFGAYKSRGDRGQVQIYDFVPDLDGDGGVVSPANEDDDIIGSWTPVGAPITGLGGDALGSAICFNADGSIIAVGAPNHANYLGTTRVYSYNPDLERWTPVGVDIDGFRRQDYQGNSVSLNGDGDILAIGASSSNFLTGYAATYKFDGGSWNMIGQLIGGAGKYYGTGSKVALNLAGDRLLVSSYFRPTDDGQRLSGEVSVYQFDDAAQEWLMMGNEDTLRGTEYYDLYGDGADINALGDRIAIGVTNHEFDEEIDNTGKVMVFEYSEAIEDWEQIGSDIYGEDQWDGLGSAVSINAKGDRVVIGASRADKVVTKPNGRANNDAGEVFVYDFDEDLGNWVQVGEKIVGECEGDQTGHAVDINADGSRIIVGGPLNQYYSGHIRMFEAVPGYVGKVDDSCFAYPTKAPVRQTPQPSKMPTPSPTKAPTTSPTKNPTPSPTKAPTASPTKNPTPSPSSSPTASPTASPTIKMATYESSARVVIFSDDESLCGVKENIQDTVIKLVEDIIGDNTEVTSSGGIEANNCPAEGRMLRNLSSMNTSRLLEGEYNLQFVLKLISSMPESGGGAGQPDLKEILSDLKAAIVRAIEDKFGIVTTIQVLGSDEKPPSSASQQTVSRVVLAAGLIALTHQMM